MNFGRGFSRLFFEPDAASLGFHYAAMAAVALVALGAMAFGFYVVAKNWGTTGRRYPRRAIPSRAPAKAAPPASPGPPSA